MRKPQSRPLSLSASDVYKRQQHEGFKYFQPAGGIAIAFDDMKTLQAHALMQAMHGGEYICDFEMGAKVDGIINAVLKSVKSGTWEKC